MDDRVLIEAAFADRSKLKDPAHAAAVERVVALLDRGELRVASPPTAHSASGPRAESASGPRAESASEAPARSAGVAASGGVGGEAPDHEWTTHAWVKQAILLYFGVRGMETMSVGPFEFHDKIPLKKDLAAQNVRVVPPGVVRFGAFCEPGVIVMPGYVNIGARVGAGSMVDTWATVGSCAQIGAHVHLSGGVGIGGVLEPPGARPVIIEDGAFIGSRVVIVEGMHIGKEAVIGTGVVLTSSTPVYDVTGSEVVEYRGKVPARSVVIPGTRPKKFPAGEFHIPCALIIGKRSESTDKKTSLNDALRDFAVPV